MPEELRGLVLERRALRCRNCGTICRLEDHVTKEACDLLEQQLLEEQLKETCLADASTQVCPQCCSSSAELAV